MGNRLNLLQWVPPWNRCISSLNQLAELVPYKRVPFLQYVCSPTIEGRFDAFTIPDGDPSNFLCLPCKTERSLEIMSRLDFTAHSVCLKMLIPRTAYT
jgi:hypothetical protein